MTTSWIVNSSSNARRRRAHISAFSSSGKWIWRSAVPSGQRSCSRRIASGSGSATFSAQASTAHFTFSRSQRSVRPAVEG
jgi:hypothetical protein